MNMGERKHMGEDETLRQRIQQLGNYLVVDFLRDGTIIGMGELMFTRAIYIDMDLNGWGKRFCFKDKDRAVEEYMKLKTGDDEPTGYIARRGR
jgi:hypothetical protein